MPPKDHNSERLLAAPDASLGSNCATKTPHYIFIYYRLLWYTICDMALSIKSVEAERLAREIAAKTGESLTDAIRKALEERLDRLRSQCRSQILASQLEEILRRVDQLPILDSRRPDEILGYDEHGLPG